MVMDLLTIHQLITLILQPIHQLITLTPQPTRASVSRFIAGHICVLAGGGEDGVASTEGDWGRRLSQEEAKRLLAKFGKRIGAATPSSGVAEVSAAHRALLGHTV